MSASRRSFIAGAGALGASALTPQFAGGAEPPRLIDLHHHFVANAGRNAPAIIAEMDRSRIAVAMGFPGQILAAERNAVRDLGRKLNEDGAQVVRDHPARFGLMAALPMQNVDDCLAEIAYAMDVLKADGFGIASSYGDAWLGDPRFEPIFAELSRRKAVVFCHPYDAPCCTPATMTYEQPPIIGPWLEWPMNTARTIVSLIANRTLTRNPDVKIVFSHGGGVMPLLVSRVAGFIAQGDGFRDPRGKLTGGPGLLARHFPDGIEPEFAKFYFELAQAYSPEYLAGLKRMVPPSHLLFGTDYPLFPMQHAAGLFAAADIPAQMRREISHENALALFPRVKANWRV